MAVTSFPAAALPPRPPHRRGPTLRECVLLHAVARLVLHPHITNIQASWVKMGPQAAGQLLAAGCNDMGGSIMNESITRAAGERVLLGGRGKGGKGWGRRITRDTAGAVCTSTTSMHVGGCPTPDCSSATGPSMLAVTSPLSAIWPACRAGAAYGQELPPAQMEEIIRAAGRQPRQRTTLYATPGPGQQAASFAAGPLQPVVQPSAASRK